MSLVSKNPISSSSLKCEHRKLSKVEGNGANFNDVIIFNSGRPAKFNLVFFGGDIQDYEEEMLKSYSSRHFAKWNLINTGNILMKKFSAHNNDSNLFIIRADYFNLRSFAK